MISAMLKVLAMVVLIAALASLSLWWGQEYQYRILHPEAVIDSTTATYSGNGYEFQYPRDWHVTPVQDAPSTTPSVYVSQYLTNDEYGIIISDEGAATFEDLRQKMKETAALPMVEDILEREPTARTLSYHEGQEIFEEAILIFPRGAISIKTHHSVDDMERHEAFVLVARTLSKVY
jgi:hypothetical protein